jgi:hypothetical protein
VEHIFLKMDTNNDKKLTLEEFVEGIKQDSAVAKVRPFPLPGTFAFPGSDATILGPMLVRWSYIIHSSAASRFAGEWKKGICRVEFGYL